MNFFEKLTNLLTSSYFNSSRLKNYKLGYLRLYFERNNKFAETITNLGNVYRNSKWSDLRVQNIKNSFLSRRFILVLSVLSLLILTLFTLNLSFFKPYIAYFPLLESTLENTHLLACQLQNQTVLFFTPAFLYLRWLSETVTSYIESVKLRVLGLRDDAVTAKKTFVSNRRQDWNKASTAFKDVAHKAHHRYKCTSFTLHTLMWTEPSFYVNSLQSLLSRFGLCPPLPELPTEFTYAPTEEEFAKMLAPYGFDLASLRPMPSPLWHPMTLGEIESSYMLSDVDTPHPNAVVSYQTDWRNLAEGFTKVLNLNDVNRIGLTTPALSPHNMNIALTLNLAKQDRWLMRNSLVSDQIGRHNNSYTQVKKLLGTNLFFSNSSNTNVWLSTKLNKVNRADNSLLSSGLVDMLYPTLTTPKTDNLTSLTTPSIQLTNLNFVEMSRLWSTKKYFLTNDYTRSVYGLTSTNTIKSPTHVSKPKELSPFDLLVTGQASAFNLNLADINIGLFDNVVEPRNPIVVSAGDICYVLTDLDLLLNTDLIFAYFFTGNSALKVHLNCTKAVKVTSYRNLGLNFNS